MKSDKNLADEFINLHLKQFGLNGTNTQKNPPAHFPSYTVAQDLLLTYKNALKFGYNGKVFNWRESSTCMFWVEYDPLAEAPSDLITEIKQNFHVIANRWPQFSLPFFGSSFSQILCQTLITNDYDFYITIPVCTDPPNLNFESEFHSKLNLGSDFSNRIEKIYFSKDEFESFLWKMAEDVRCVDPLAGFSAFIGTKSKYPHIYHSPWPHISDQNYDSISQSAVGPSNWCLVDNESDFALARYLMKNQTEGVFNFFYYRHNCLAAILASPVWKDWLKKSSLDNSRQPNSDDFFQRQFIQSYFPETYDSESWKQLNHDLFPFKDKLLQRYPKANEAWLTPLNRLLEDLQIQYDFDFHKNKNVYGTVFKNSPPVKT